MERINYAKNILISKKLKKKGECGIAKTKENRFM